MQVVSENFCDIFSIDGDCLLPVRYLASELTQVEGRGRLTYSYTVDTANAEGYSVLRITTKPKEYFQ